jgi:predicted transglutaminase-like cysteine proteinase
VVLSPCLSLSVSNRHAFASMCARVRECASVVGQLARQLLPACALMAIVCAGTSTKAWDAERMTAAAQRLGPRATSGVIALQSTLSAARDLDELAQLNALNQFFNRRIEFRDDSEAWGQHDYWASPLESLGRGQGDCEDFAIAKYFSLLALGMPSAKLRMVYVRVQLGGPGGPTRAHMVLAFYASAGADPLILDNLITDVRPASRRPDLEPVFSFNGEGLWQGVGAQTAGDPVARLSRWREVLVKARAEGFHESQAREADRAGDHAAFAR